MTVVGVDGWRGGWVAAAEQDGTVTWELFDRFAELLGSHRHSTIAVDMPIGLGTGRREADQAARRWLAKAGGPPSSIFNTPPEDVVDAWTKVSTHASAMASRPRGARTSVQAWNLIEKIRDLRDALAMCPHADVVEAHPECTLRLIDPATPHASKKTGLGVARRMGALRRAGLAVDLLTAPPGVPVDDLLDAAVLIHTARRVAEQDPDLRSLPVDATGVPRIVI